MNASLLDEEKNAVDSNESQDSLDLADTSAFLDVQKLSMSNSSKGGPEASTEISSHLTNGTRSNTIQRDEAKRALLEFHEHGIEFEQLVLEGLDPSVLLPLYVELNISVPSANVQRPVDDDIEPGEIADGEHEQIRSAHNGSTGDRTGPLDSALILQSSTVTPNGTAKPTSKAQDHTKAKSPKVSQIVPDVTIPVPESCQEAELQKKAPLSDKSNEKFPVPPTAIVNDKALERKDYIARMLAAKVGKPLGTSKASSVAKVTVKHNDQKRQPTAPEAKSMDVIISKNRETPDLVITDDAEAKRKAQTDLARQKMLALKKRNHDLSRVIPRSEESAQQTLQSSTTTALSQDIGDTHFSSPATFATALNQSDTEMGYIPPHNVSTTKPQTQYSVPYTPRSSMFTPSRRAPLSGIPGLFMSSTPTANPPDQPSISIHTSQHREPAPSQVITVPAKSTMTVTRDVSRSRTPLAVAEVVSNLASEEEDVVQPAKEIVSDNVLVRESRKRPKASDFIEPPPTRLKKRLDSSEFAQLIIDVSEDEADDEGSQNADSRKEPENERVAAPQIEERRYPTTNVLQTTPQLSDLASKSKVSTVSSIDTPPAISTPSKQTEQDDLQRKEQQIQLMQRKIAELEQRRRAKHSESRQQTPGDAGRSDSSPNPETLPAAQRVEKNPNTENSVAEKSIQSNDTEEAELLSAEATVGNHIRTQQKVGAILEEQIQMQEAALFAAQAAADDQIRAKKRAETMLDDQIQAERATTSNQARLADMQRRRARIANIEAGLPELDAGIEKSRLLLESLARQKVEVEAEIQRGTQGRQMLIQELNSLAEPEHILQASQSSSVSEQAQNIPPISKASVKPGK